MSQSWRLGFCRLPATALLAVQYSTQKPVEPTIAVKSSKKDDGIPGKRSPRGSVWTWWLKTIDQIHRISSYPPASRFTRGPYLYAASEPARTRDSIWSRVVYRPNHGRLSWALGGWRPNRRCPLALSTSDCSHIPVYQKAMLAPSVTHNLSPCTRRTEG